MRTSLLLLATLACSMSLVMGHDFWIELNTYDPAPGSPMTVTLKSGHALAGESIPRTARQLDDFILFAATGTSTIAGIEGRTPAGFFKASGEGARTVAYITQTRTITLPAKKFDEHLASEGLTAILAARREKGDSGKPAVEAYTKYAKCLLRVGSGAGPQVFSPVGHRIEIVPECDPTHPHFDGVFLGRVLIDGKARESLLVAAFDAPDCRPLRAQTDAEGRFTLRLTQPGLWLLKSVHMASSSVTGAEWESHWASLVFQY